jgi:hypothetical protein
LKVGFTQIQRFQRDHVTVQPRLPRLQFCLLLFHSSCSLLVPPHHNPAPRLEKKGHPRVDRLMHTVQTSATPRDPPCVLAFVKCGENDAVWWFLYVTQGTSHISSAKYMGLKGDISLSNKSSTQPSKNSHHRWTSGIGAVPSSAVFEDQLPLIPERNTFRESHTESRVSKILEIMDCVHLRSLIRFLVLALFGDLLDCWGHSWGIKRRGFVVVCPSVS